MHKAYECNYCGISYDIHDAIDVNWRCDECCGTIIHISNEEECDAMINLGFSEYDCNVSHVEVVDIDEENV